MVLHKRDGGKNMCFWERKSLVTPGEPVSCFITCSFKANLDISVFYNPSPFSTLVIQFASCLFKHPAMHRISCEPGRQQ